MHYFFFTAAHCLMSDPYYTDLYYINNLFGNLQERNLNVAFGNFNSRQWTESGINRQVARYRIHPDYKHTNSADSDLAILTLRMPIEYSPFIRPICLWSGSSDLQDIVNRFGYVVGWGKDQLGNDYNDEPRMAKMLIKSQVKIFMS